MSNEPTHSDMESYYDSQKLKGRTVRREGEILFGENIPPVDSMIALNAAILELKVTRAQIVNDLVRLGF